LGFFSSFINYIIIFITLIISTQQKYLNTHYVHTVDLKKNSNNKYILENSEKMNFIIDVGVLVYTPERVSIVYKWALQQLKI